MEKNLLQFQNLINNYSIKKESQILITNIKKYNFLFASNNQIMKENQNIKQNILKSKIIIIKQYESKNQTSVYKYHMLSFEQTIIFVDNLSNSLLNDLLSINPNLSFLFLTNPKTILNNAEIKYNEAKPHEKFNEEIENFTKSSQFFIKINEPIIQSLFFNIRTCIAAYLIQKSYQKLEIDKKTQLKTHQSQDEMLNEIDKKHYIRLRLLGIGTSFVVYLNYHIEKEKLFVIKISKCETNEEKVKLIERINTNCPKLNHPFLSQFYGKIKNTQNIAMEFIHGQGLSTIDISEYTDSEIFIILYELILAIDYLHKNQFVYRDLNPSNVIIDKYKNAIIIDFDRMINYDDINNDRNLTNLFPESTAPEVNFGVFSYKSDIYSLGYIMKYLISKRIQRNEMYSKLQTIYEQFFKENQDDRPSILELIENFISINFLLHQSIHVNLKKDNNSFHMNINDDFNYYLLTSIQNDQESQHQNEDKFISLDINKSIHSLSIASDQNDREAQFQLGRIYYDGKLITRDINKSIHYFSLAADQNCPTWYDLL